jgi:hypothetical protein
LIHAPKKDLLLISKKISKVNYGQTLQEVERSNKLAKELSSEDGASE